MVSERQWLERFGALRVLVIGDFMIDEYLLGRADRVSPEAPVPVVHLESEQHRLGGAGNVAHNLRALECQVEVAGVIGDDAAGLRMVGLLEAAGISAAGLLRDPERPTIQKVRVVAHNQQMLRYDREKAHPIAGALEDRLWQAVAARLASVDIVVLSDYAKGTLTPRLLGQVIAATRQAGRKIVADPKGRSYERYRGASALTPNEAEALLAAGSAAGSDEDLLEVGRLIVKDVDLEALCITRGPRGVLLLTADGEARTLPTEAVEVFDVTGAGDTFIAAFVACLAAGAGYPEAARIANVAAGIAVGKSGTATVTIPEVLHALRDAESHGTVEEIGHLTRRLRERGKRVVLAGGDFDLLGVDHLRFLERARLLGDALVVAVESDASIAARGGAAAVVAEAARARMVAALHVVDHVVVCDRAAWTRLLEVAEPQVLAAPASGTFAPSEAERAQLRARGGMVATVASDEENGRRRGDSDVE